MTLTMRKALVAWAIACIAIIALFCAPSAWADELVSEAEVAGDGDGIALVADEAEQNAAKTFDAPEGDDSALTENEGANEELALEEVASEPNEPESFDAVEDGSVTEVDSAETTDTNAETAVLEEEAALEEPITITTAAVATPAPVAAPKASAPKTTAETKATTSSSTSSAKSATSAATVKVAAQSTSKTAASTASTAAKKTTAAKSTVAARTLADGIYYIESRLNLANVLGIAGGSKANSGNAFSVVYDGTAAQRWKVVYNAKTGFYSIINVNSGLALDVTGAKGANGTNVQQYKSNGSKAQQWQFLKQGSGYVVKSALGNFVLDIAGANQNSKTNVQLYSKNGTQAQWWQFVSTKPVAAEKTVLENGTYLVSVGSKTGMKMDVAGGSTDNGGNVQIFTGNASLAQRWYITHDKDNYYTIASVGSGKVLDVSGAKMVAGANVQQYTSNGTNAQKWVLHKNSDGSFTFISKLNGMVLDLVAGKTTDSTNVQTYLSNGSAAQKFKLAKQKQMLPNGIYSIAPIYALGKSVDVTSASTSSGTQLQLWDYSKVIQQKYQLNHLGNDVYTFTAGISGMNISVDAAGGKVVQAKASEKNAKQQWVAIWNNGGITFKNASSGKVIDVAGAGTANGAKLQAYKRNNSKAQKFLLISRPVIEDGTYYVLSALDKSKTLDVSGANANNGGNIQIWSKGSAFNQRFEIKAVGSAGYYKIVNVMSNKALDVTGGSKANSANVQQYDYNGSAAQLWKAEFSPNGGIVFVNKGSGKVLDVAGAKNANGANVQQYTNNNSKAQRWTLEATTKLTDLQMVAYRKAVSHGSKTNWYIAADLTHHRTYVFKRVNGDWELQRDVICTVGNPKTPTPTGEYTVKRKRYSYEGYYHDEPYIAYYYTSIGNTGKYFHSPLYARGAKPGSKSYGGWGKNLSLGCVRLQLDNAIYVYNNVSVGSHVSIYH